MYKSRHLLHLPIILFSLFFLFSHQSEAAEKGQIISFKETTAAKNVFYEKSWAVIIGINEYEHWPELSYAINDANDVNGILEEMGFETKVFLNKEATKDSIMGYLMNELPQKTGKDDRLILFFSGHGHTTTFKTGNKRGFIIPVDGKKEQPYSNISMNDLLNLTDMLISKHIFFILDACFAGSLVTLASESRNRGYGESDYDIEYVKELAKKNVCQILTAGGDNQKVIEIDGHGIFTQELIKALKGAADHDHDYYITGLQLANYVRHQVALQSKTRQMPIYGEFFSQGGDMIFILPRTLDIDYEKTKAMILQETDIDRILTIYNNFCKKHNAGDAYIELLDNDCKRKIEEIQAGNQIIRMIRNVSHFNKAGEIMETYGSFAKQYPESAFLMKINDEIGIMTQKIIRLNELELKIKSSESINELETIKTKEMAAFQEDYPEYENIPPPLMELWKSKKNMLEEKRKKKITVAKKSIENAANAMDIETIKNNFHNNDLWEHLLEPIARQKEKELEYIESQMYKDAQDKLTKAKSAYDVYLIYMEFNEQFPRSKYLESLDETTNLKNAELRMREAKTVGNINAVLTEFSDILQTQENKKILAETAKEACKKIRDAEDEEIRESHHGRIASAKDLCELSMIEEEVNIYIQAHPDYKDASVLKELLNDKREQLKTQNQSDLNIAKKELDNEWDPEDVLLVASIFGKKYTCSIFLDELNKYANARVSKLEKIAEEYESILKDISESTDLTSFAAVKMCVDNFLMEYKDYPHAAILPDNLQKKHTELKGQEEQAFENAKKNLGKTQTTGDAELVYRNFEETFSSSKFIVALKELTELRKAKISMKPATGDSWEDPITGIEYVYIPGGSFYMGDTFGDEDDEEKQLVKVNIKGFWMSRHEVTQGTWKQIMYNNPSYFKNGDSFPVEMVSWNDVQVFIKELNSLHQGVYTFRLPTEAEWEYACREGGKQVRFGNGENIIDPKKVNFNGDSRFKEPYSIAGEYRKQTTPTGSFPPNSLGLYDMSGNVWEWTQDNYNFETGAEISKTNPEKYYVIRGGSWNFRPLYLRAANRTGLKGTARLWDTGFRVVRQTGN
ncbi:MAG: SUMF1/EgtB/PvdO family nonheme iron enzyme [Candidatus Kuenenia sp.]|nr:SUMF1/EgtB/PvdO family nonheme iron enzyme [Candidatus Kuenenia hertensis]